MKKLMIMLGVVAMAVGVQAAAFNWNTTSKLYGVTAASVGDNGVYAAASSGTTDRGDKVLTLAYTLSILDASTDALIGSASGTVTYGSLGKVGVSNIDVAAAEQGTTYKYVLALTGTQSNLSGRGVDGSYDYSGATLATEMSGTITTATMGDTNFDATLVPTSWTVSGIAPVPEPTSGLLMLVGLGALALRRRRA